MELIELLPEIGKSCICLECVMAYLDGEERYQAVNQPGQG